MVFVPILCNTVAIPKSVPTPEGSPEPPKNLLCPRCNAVSSTTYRKDLNRCDICFICAIPCKSGAPYLSCKSCGYNLGSSRIYCCSKCGIKSISKSNFCSSCGQKEKQ